MAVSTIVEPEVRVWELNNSTISRSSVYSIMVAAPSDDELNIMWILQSCTAAFWLVFVGIIFSAMASDRHLRRSPFNLYVIFSMAADLVLVASLTVSNALNWSRGFVTQGQCNFQVWYSQWSLVSTCWINVFMAREIHKLLSASHVRKRYDPPSTKRVVLQSFGSYAAAVIVCSIPYIELLPLKIRLVHGFVCLPYEHSLSSSLFLHLVYVPLQMYVPMIFVIYYLSDIFLRGKLPRRGARRELGLYIFRVCFVLLVCMAPTLVCVVMLRRRANPWAFWAATEWGISYVGASGILVLMRTEVLFSVRKFVTCHCSERLELVDLYDQCSHAFELNDSNINDSGSRNQSGSFNSRGFKRSSTTRALVRSSRSLASAQPNRSSFVLASSLRSSIEDASPSKNGNKNHSKLSVIDASGESDSDNIVLQAPQSMNGYDYYDGSSKAFLLSCAKRHSAVKEYLSSSLPSEAVNARNRREGENPIPALLHEMDESHVKCRKLLDGDENIQNQTDEGEKTQNQPCPLNDVDEHIQNQSDIAVPEVAAELAESQTYEENLEARPEEGQNATNCCSTSEEAVASIDSIVSKDDQC